MRYLVTAQEMKQYDKNTIEYLGIPGPVLMERAALAAEDFLKERFDAVKERTKVLIFAGMGNNGGDGLALAYPYYFQERVTVNPLENLYSVSLFCLWASLS